MVNILSFNFEDNKAIAHLHFAFFYFKVPNSANGKLKIENTEFLDEYKDHESPIYQTISREIEAGLMESLQEFNNVHVKVLNLT